MEVTHTNTLTLPHRNLEEVKLGGDTIPKEIKVVVNAWWLANNPSEFQPYRFLEEDGGTQVVVGDKMVNFRFLPFDVGRRSCLGIILALPFLGLVIRNLVSNFEMHRGRRRLVSERKEGSSVCTLQTIQRLSSNQLVFHSCKKMV